MLSKNEWVDMHAFQFEMGLDEPTVIELYGIFAEELEEETNKLGTAMASGDYLQLSRIVHNIKGISASYKAGAALLQAVHIDLLCKGEHWDAVEQKILGFQNILSQTVDSIWYLLGKDG